jgi:hypothetical protein
MTRAVLRVLATGLATVLAAGLALLLAAAPAAAHTRLESSDPADGASIAAGPDTVTLRFNEDIRAEFATVTVVGPDGAQYQQGPVSASGGRVDTAVAPLGPAGAYRIGYRVISGDGHPVQGTLSFTLTAPGPAAAPLPPAAAAPPAPDPVAAPVDRRAAAQQGGEAPVWPWLLGAVVLVGAGAAAALRPGRGNR